jgi:DNA-binding NarL/FixJ family response regulator
MAKPAAGLRRPREFLAVAMPRSIAGWTCRERIGWHRDRSRAWPELVCRGMVYHLTTSCFDGGRCADLAPALTFMAARWLAADPLCWPPGGSPSAADSAGVRSEYRLGTRMILVRGDSLLSPRFGRLSAMNGRHLRSEPADGVRVLIIDGHTLFCAGMVRLLKGFRGIGPVKAVTGLEEAIRLLKPFCPDVVLIDPSLPDAGPFEVARRVRVHCPDARLLFLDASVREVHVRAAVEAGAVGYWTKHATVAQIVKAIGQAETGQTAFCRGARQYLVATCKGLRFKPSGRSAALEQLTARELEIFLYLAQGLSVKQCAERMRIAPNTADNHKARLMRKLGLHKSVDLALLAFREGLVD